MANVVIQLQFPYSGASLFAKYLSGIFGGSKMNANSLDSTESQAPPPQTSNLNLLPGKEAGAQSQSKHPILRVGVNYVMANSITQRNESD